MRSFDSDEEDDYLDQDLTETTVLLGYACKEAGDDTISHLGGRPEWLDPASPPSGALAKCRACSAPMALLLQLNAELPERFPTHDRRLWVFACRRPQCARARGSVRAVRGTRVSVEAAALARREVEDARRREEEEERRRVERAEFGDRLFGGSGIGGGGGGGGNPFAAGGNNPFSGGGGVGGGNPFSSSGGGAGTLPQTFAAALTLNASPTASSTVTTATKTANTTTTTTNGPPEPWPAESSLPKAYPVLYLADAEYETLDPTPAALPANTRLLPADAEDPSVAPSSSSGGEDKEAYESAMDAVFQRFADRLAQNPEQCIRYEFAGTPLLYSRDDAVGKLLDGGGPGGRMMMPKCERCGAARVFEVQMTPHAIAEMEAEEVGFDGMEWGTIIVGVCEEDCGGDREDGRAGYVEEWVGVQWEEAAKK